ncbi:MAG TPA: hypothetical protein VIY48_14445 [Candidatus Paceibacterota bacterium]
MEAMYTYHPATPDRKDDYMVVASAVEWTELAEIVWNWAPDLDAPVVRDFLQALEGQGIRP